MDKVASAVAGYKKDTPPSFHVGDTVDVKVRIKEGDKLRTQTFSGVVISIRGSGISRSFTVRRIVQSEGVERTFPLHSPFVQDVIVRKRARVRRAKLYYLRGRTGKRARMKERLDFKTGGEDTGGTALEEPPPEVEQSALTETAGAET